MEPNFNIIKNSEWDLIEDNLSQILSKKNITQEFLIESIKNLRTYWINNKNCTDIIFPWIINKVIDNEFQKCSDEYFRSAYRNLRADIYNYKLYTMKKCYGCDSEFVNKFCPSHGVDNGRKRNFS